MLLKNSIVLGIVALFFVSLCSPDAAYAADKSKKSKKTKSSKTKEAKKSKVPAVEPSKATTFEEAMDEGEERIAMMEYGSAQRSYEKALTLARNNEQKGKASKGLAAAYNNLGQQEKALQTVLDSAQYYPELDTPEKTAAARLQYIDATYKEARRIAYEVIAGDDTKLRHEVVDSALEVPDMGTQWQVDWHRAKMGLYTTNKIKDFAKVEEWQKKALMLPDLKPVNHFEISSTMGGCYSTAAYYSKKDPELYAKARDFYNQAQNTPDYVMTSEQEIGINGAIGNTYWETRDFPAAREMYEKNVVLGEKAKRNDVVFYAKMRIGECYRAESNKSEAKRYFEECLAMADKYHAETWRAHADASLKTLE